MAEIIDSTTDIKKYIAVNVNINFKTLSPSIDNALIESIIPVIGDEIVDDVKSNMASVDDLYPQIIPLLQRTLTCFSVLKALPFLEVNVGDQGITRTENANFKTAYRGQVARIEEQLKADAYNSLERLLSFFEKNKDE